MKKSLLAMFVFAFVLTFTNNLLARRNEPTVKELMEEITITVIGCRGQVDF